MRKRCARARPPWRRRLADRIDQRLSLAYRHELDATFRDIMRDAWSIAIPRSRAIVQRRCGMRPAKLRFKAGRAEARKAWLPATRLLKKKRSSSIERQ